MTAEDKYLRSVVMAIMRVRGLRHGLNAPGAPQIARTLIKKFGRQKAYLGLMGTARANMEAATTAFVKQVLSAKDALPAAVKWRNATIAISRAVNKEIASVVIAGHNSGLPAAYAIATPAAPTTSAAFSTAFKGVDKAVEQWTRANVGAPTHQAAAELFADLIGPKRMPGAKAIGHRGEEIRRAVQRIGSLRSRTPYLPQRVAGRMERILVSEMRGITHSSNLYAAAQSPACKYVQWTLSTEHADEPSSPDECDVYAYADHGAGPGLYRPENAPTHPHPYCQCEVFPVVLPREQWGEQPPPPPPKIPSKNNVERILKQQATKNSPTLTDARLKRMTRHTQHNTRSAHTRYIQSK